MRVPDQVSPFKVAGSKDRYIEETLITAGDDVNQVLNSLFFCSSVLLSSLELSDTRVYEP